MRRWTVGMLAGTLVSALGFVAAPEAAAGTYQVTTATGAGAGSLTAEINAANSDGTGGTITFQNGLGTIVLPSPGLPVVTDQALTIDGCDGSPAAGGCQRINANSVTDTDIAGNGVFEVNAPDVTITGINLNAAGAGTNGEDFRLVYADAAATDLTLTYDTFTGDTSGINPVIDSYADGLTVGGLDPSTHQPRGGVVISGNGKALWIESGDGDVIEGNTLGTQNDEGLRVSGNSATLEANTITIPSANGGGFSGIYVDFGVTGTQIGDSTLQAPPNHITGFDNAVDVVTGVSATFYDNTGTANTGPFYLVEDTGSGAVDAPTITSASGTISGTAPAGSAVELISSNTPGPPGGADELDGVLATVTTSGGTWSYTPPTSQTLPPYVTAIASLAGQGSSQTAAWHAVSARLTVAAAGSGVGTVTSQPAGISCPGTCSLTEPVGTKVTLSAAASGSSVFSGWSGGSCSGTGTCTVTLSQTTTVTATFIKGATLTVVTSGATQYNDYVTSTPTGIFCGHLGGSTCTLSVTAGTPVTLTALDNAAAGTIFTGWSGGGCSGVGACTVTVTSDITVTANYGVLPASPTGAIDIAPLFWAGPYSIGSGSFEPYGISCPSVSLCVSTGYDHYEGPVGSDKAAIATSGTFGAAKVWSTGELDGSNIILAVSCPTISFCAASDDGGNILTTTDPFQGAGDWTVTHVNYGSVPNNGVIDGISCATPSNCVAVDQFGNVITSTNPTGGSGAWTAKAIDYPNQLNDVSCPALGTCVAIDSTGTVLVAIGSSAANQPASAASWNPTTVDGGNSLQHISCFQALCAVTDTAGNVITTTNVTGGASAWHAAHLAADSLTGISCANSSFCTTGDVGYKSFTSVNPTGGASTWTAGGVWMRGVSCVNALIHNLGADTYCVAITTYGWTIGTIPELSIMRLGTGSGTVAVTPAGTACPSTCTSLFPIGSVETLIATPNAGVALSGWRGPCTPSGLTCKATMNATANIAAIFSTAPASSSGGTVTITPTTVTGTVACRTKIACAGTLTLAVPVGGIAKAGKPKASKPVVISTGRFKIRAHRHKAVTLKLNATGRKLERKHRLKILTETITVNTGKHASAISVAKLKARYRG